jgi:hypothetical protein
MECRSFGPKQESGRKCWIDVRLNPLPVGKFLLLAVISGIVGNFNV